MQDIKSNTMQYKATDGTIVQLEQWQWRADYTNSQYLLQFDAETSAYHSFNEIDQSKLRSFSMICAATGQKHTLLLPTGAKLIHFYRNVVLEAYTQNEQKIKLYCYGYELAGHKVLHAITPKNNILTVDSERLITLANIQKIDR